MDASTNVRCANKYLRVKRGLDFIMSLICLLVLSPVLLGIAIVVKLTSPGPVLFRQERSGLHRKHFMIYKFRTMKTGAPRNRATNRLENAQKYITPMGRFLRKTSLDELPQLLNILKGEMSFVGPRPVINAEFDLLNERDKYGANDVLPGLTGLAQINGRDRVNYKDKARMDGEYAANITFSGDLKLILHTVSSVFTAKDVVEGCQDQN